MAEPRSPRSVSPQRRCRVDTSISYNPRRLLPLKNHYLTIPAEDSSTAGTSRQQRSCWRALHSNGVVHGSEVAGGAPGAQCEGGHLAGEDGDQQRHPHIHLRHQQPRRRAPAHSARLPAPRGDRRSLSPESAAQVNVPHCDHAHASNPEHPVCKQRLDHVPGAWRDLSSPSRLSHQSSLPRCQPWLRRLSKMVGRLTCRLRAAEPTEQPSASGVAGSSAASPRATKAYRRTGAASQSTHWRRRSVRRPEPSAPSDPTPGAPRPRSCA